MSAAAIVVTIALLMFNGVFVAVEFALVASRRVRLEQGPMPLGRRARAALRALDHFTDYIAGVQLGVTMTSLGLGAVAEPAIGHGLEDLFGLGDHLPHGLVTALAFVLALAFVAFLHSVFGELVPKNLAIADAERSLSILAAPMAVFVAVFKPVVIVLDALAGAGLRLLKVQRRRELVSAHTADELGHLVSAARAQGFIGESEHRRLTGAIEFAGRPVREVMVPRDRIVAAPLSVTVSEAEQMLLSSGHSRLPIYERDLDRVLGFVHVKDLLALDAASATQVLPARSLRRMLLVAANRPLPDVLVSMRRSRLHVALVVDADGRTAGLVTLEDLLEELVGEITDETDRARP